MKFTGKYYKHQHNGNTLCLIEGKAKTGKFLQVVANDKVYQFDSYNNCCFSDNGISLDLPNIKGKIDYCNLTPLKSDIMGYFRFFPLQCRHYVYSMHHDLTGKIEVDGNTMDFDDGKGYMEGDSGRSFPKNYLWIQCNDFPQKCSIMASVASIPFLGFRFWGCICAIIFEGKEYRLATYNGVKIEKRTKTQLVLSQKKLRLEIETNGKNFVPLKMPQNGKMSAVTHECNSAYARFKFYESDRLIFDFSSSNASYEYHF